MTATASSSVPKTVTYEQYLEEYRCEPPSRQPYHILDGVVIMSPSPQPIHQRITYRLGILLDRFEVTGGIRVLPSPLDVVVRRAPLRTRQPDILVMSEGRLAEAGGFHATGPIEVAPELVIEVLSPSETRRTIGDKIADFQAMGVRECWLVSSEAETVEVLSLTAEEIRTVTIYGRSDVVQSEVFAAVKLPVSEIFGR